MTANNLVSATTVFTKILIANRGEIACRIMRTAAAMGIKTVAVYSDADAQAVHVTMADEAYRLGPAPASESYLLIDKIVSIALACGAEAIHPGYGFLSENADFARACAEAGIVFIGPPVSAIEAMGAKDTAKKIMHKARVPLVPGYHDEDQTEAVILRAAQGIGFPVLLKATAGGGGKGMRVVESEADFSHAFKSTKREALSSFGNDQLLVEKYVLQPRHIEIQVFCDSHGNGVFLFERDCSIQRRHQKVLEEAPAPDFSEALRQQMGEAALQAAKAINYVGAGTIEFLLDASGAFYFMEMNTRLQVEHPVTEAISGQDLVQWQLIVAAGGTLPLTQSDLQIQGHAIEVRIYAENPEKDFLPATGTLHYLKTPALNDYVRIDSGVIQGDTITPFYDPMIAKLIVWGEDRAAAIKHLSDALAHYHIVGLHTNIEFLQRLIHIPAFHEAQLNTGFIDTHHKHLFAQTMANNESALTNNTPVAIYAAALFLLLNKDPQEPVSNDHYSPWRIYQGFRLNEFAQDRLQLHDHKHDITTALAVDYIDDHFSNSRFQMQCAEQPPVIVSGVLQQHQLAATIDHKHYRFSVYPLDQRLTLYCEGQRSEIENLQADTRHTDESAANGSVTAPMNGRIIEIAVNVNDTVKAGDPLVTLEAMKMEHTIYAPADGTIKAVFFACDDMVNEASVLVDLEVAEQ